MGPLITLFWTSVDVWPRFQYQVDPFPACNGFLRFSPSAALADLLKVSVTEYLGNIKN